MEATLQKPASRCKNRGVQILVFASDAGECTAGDDMACLSICGPLWLVLSRVSRPSPSRVNSKLFLYAHEM
jgi:hypothetical protein